MILPGNLNVRPNERGASALPLRYPAAYQNLFLKATGKIIYVENLLTPTANTDLTKRTHLPCKSPT